MPQFNLHLVARNTPGCLERILNTSRVRGFEITNFSAKLDHNERYYQIDLAVNSQRSQQLLIMQLAKQYDIRELAPVKMKRTIRSAAV
ncbi:ACT domain-containing protein [Zooshikella harenae]|uniref:Acetolactate synthase 2 small subunit n=1 Tax=Zooshikella harenae TaxID=2827238 RepID=A0ABS5ZIS8_9GAMM|nr:acetolactate synthase 2 small subunit [Zooshikella harenae]MBU2713978.1 acetolactate synthase 2 small subunit [Zooshikella harenae]